MHPEHTQHERLIEYAAALRERFASGVLSELRPLNQWVVWKAELEEGKRKKVPYNPNYRLAKASVKIPKSWGTLDEALAALETGNYTGLGFMITPPLVMVDLDHSFDRATGIITDPQVEKIVHSLHSYTEASPGRGVHILAYGKLPGKNFHTAIEMYGQDRFTTITTDHLTGTPTTIEKRQEALASLYSRFAPQVSETSNQNVLWCTNSIGGENVLTELPPEALNEPLLQQLLAGDISQFGNDQSRADFVLIMRLLDWTGDNISLTRELFLQSPLGQREKAQRKTGPTTYVDMTINNVLKKRRRPSKRRP